MTLKCSDTAPHIEYYHVSIDAWGIKWCDTVTSVWLQKNADKYGPVLQIRAATKQEISDHIKRYVLSIE